MNTACKIILIILLILLARAVISLIYYIYISNELEASINHINRCVDDIFDVLNTCYKKFSLDTNGYIKEAKIIFAKLRQLRACIHMSSIGPFSAYYIFDKYMDAVFDPFYAGISDLISKYYIEYEYDEQFKKSIDLLRKRNEDDLRYVENFRKKNKVKKSWRCDYENNFVNELKMSLDNIEVRRLCV